VRAGRHRISFRLNKTLLLKWGLASEQIVRSDLISLMPQPQYCRSSLNRPGEITISGNEGSIPSRGANHALVD